METSHMLLNNQSNSTNLQVSVAMHSISIATPMRNSTAPRLLSYGHDKHVT
jgi:hypothetical protein